MAPRTPPTEGRRFVWQNLVAGVATIAGGLLGFALQALASHALHPAQYGRAIAVFTLFTLLTQPAAAFARLVTWNTSRDLSVPGSSGGDSGILLRNLTMRLLTAGSVLTVLAIVTGRVVADYMHVPFEFIVVGALAVPFMLAAPPLIGDLQGQERFVPWSVLSVVVAGSRLLFVALLVFTMGALGVLWGITVASAVTFAITLAWVWPRMRGARGRVDWRPRIRFIVLAVTSTLAVSIFLSVDVVMVEHFFNKVQAGQYAAMAVLSRSIYFATGGVASVQFPKAASRHARYLSTIGVVAGSLGLCALCGLVGISIFLVAGRLVLRGFSGGAYVAGARYLGWYGVGMTLLAGGVILVNTQQSLNKLSLLWFLLPLIAVEPTLILLFHRTLFSVVVDSDVSIAIFVLVIGALYIYGELTDRRIVAIVSGPPSASAAPGGSASASASAAPASASASGSAPAVPASAAAAPAGSARPAGSAPPAGWPSTLRRRPHLSRQAPAPAGSATPAGSARPARAGSVGSAPPAGSKRPARAGSHFRSP